jgi:hypothetical protein
MIKDVCQNLEVVDNELLFIDHFDGRGVSATVRHHRRTERFFPVRGFDLELSVMGEAEWEVELVSACKAPRCFIVKPVKKIDIEGKKPYVYEPLKRGIDIMVESFGISWNEITKTIGRSEAIDLALDEGRR